MPLLVDIQGHTLKADQLLDDSISLLHNPKGDICSHAAQTGIKRTGSMILKNMALILADGVCGALTGEYFNLSGTSKWSDSDVKSSITSGMVRSDGHYYVSDKNRLYCLDGKARQLWSYLFPKNTLSNASIRWTAPA